ncbi:MAG: hypothetical protein WCH65_02655 [bacterium]
MERFTLLFKSNQNPSLLAAIAEHLATNNCSFYFGQKTCPIKNENPSIDFCYAAQADEFSKIKTLIDHLHPTPFINIMVLIDDKEDIAYIYKGVGSEKEIKKNVLPPIIKAYESLTHKSVFLKIQDVRETMGICPNPQMN